MNRTLTVVLVLLIGANAWYAWHQTEHASPQKTVLDQHLATLDQEIAEAKTASARYGGGLIATLIEVRLEILKTTRALLVQKRMSLLRAIDLSYSVEGRPLDTCQRNRTPKCHALI